MIFINKDIIRSSTHLLAILTFFDHEL